MIMTRTHPQTAPYPSTWTDADRTGSRSMPYLGAAIPVGLAGAASVAIFLLVLDALAGAPLATPNMLGAALFRGEPLTSAAAIQPGLVFGYTLLHGAAFLVVAAAAVSAEYTLSSRGVPIRLQLVFGVLGLFGGLQAMFMLVALLLGLSWETLGIERIAVANAIAAVVMAFVVSLRRRVREDPLHPEGASR